MRDDITDDELADWLQIVYSSLILMRGMRPAEDRAVVERFVLTSLKMVATAT